MRHTRSSMHAAAETRDAPLHGAVTGLECRRDHNVTKRNMTLLAALQVDRAGHCLVAVERAAGETRNLLVVDDGRAVQHDGDLSADERDVVGLPDIRTARQLRIRCDEAVDSAGVL